MQKWNQKKLIRWINSLDKFENRREKVVAVIKEFEMDGSDFTEDIEDSQGIDETFGIGPFYAKRLMKYIENQKDQGFKDAIGATEEKDNDDSEEKHDHVFKLNIYGANSKVCGIDNVRATCTVKWLKEKYIDLYGQEHVHERYEDLALRYLNKRLTQDDKPLSYYKITKSTCAVFIEFKCSGGGNSLKTFNRAQKVTFADFKSLNADQLQKWAWSLDLDIREQNMIANAIKKYSLTGPRLAECQNEQDLNGIIADPEVCTLLFKLVMGDDKMQVDMNGHYHLSYYTNDELKDWIYGSRRFKENEKKSIGKVIMTNELTGSYLVGCVTENDAQLGSYFDRNVEKRLFGKVKQKMELDELYKENIGSWTGEQVQIWIKSLGVPLSSYAKSYKNVDGKHLLYITDNFRITRPNHRKLFEEKLLKMRNQSNCPRDNEKNKKNEKMQTFADTPMEKWTRSMTQNWIKSLPHTFHQYNNKFSKVNGSQLKDMDNDDLSYFISAKLNRKFFLKQLENAIEKYGGIDGNNGENANKGVNGVVGLDNLGNTCYLNTSIQVLSQTQLATYLAKRAKMIGIKQNGSWYRNEKPSMLNSWMELCDVIYNKHNNKKYSHETFSPQKIVYALRDIDSEFGSGRQDDATRSLRFMLQALDEEIEKELMKSKNTKKEVDYLDHVDIEHGKKLEEKEEKMVIDTLLRKHNPNDTIVRRLFDGVMRIINTCLGCGFIHQQYVIYRELDLPVGTNYVTFQNINVIFKSDGERAIETEKMECTVLNYCSLDVLKYAIMQGIRDLKGHQRFENCSFDNISMNCIDIVNVRNYEVQSVKSMKECIQSTSLFAFCGLSQHTKAVSKVYMFWISDQNNEYTLNCANRFCFESSQDSAIKSQIRDLQEKCSKDRCLSIFYNGEYINLKNLRDGNFGENHRNNTLIFLQSSQKTRRNEEILDIKSQELCHRIHNRYRNDSMIAALKKHKKSIQSEIDILNKGNTKTSNIHSHYGWSMEIQDKLSKNNYRKMKEELNTINNCIKYFQIIDKMYIDAALTKRQIWKFLEEKCVTNTYEPSTLKSVSECFQELQAVHIYDDSRFNFNCPQCKCYVKLTKQQKCIVYKPQVWILHLDRFGKNASNNNECSVSTKFRKNECIDAFDEDDQIWRQATIVNVYPYSIRVHWCGYHAKYNETISIYNPSRIRRYSSDRTSNKFTHAVNYPMKLQLNDNEQYKLIGVSNHSGNTTKCGHYTANVHCKTDQNWYKISDINVYTSSKESALTNPREATILIYSNQQ